MAKWVILLSCGWLAASISGAAGFGGALLLLPVLVRTVGAGAAVPILTVAQLLGNLSRAGFGWRAIRWRPALIFSAGAIPASVVGSRLFVDLNNGLLPRVVGGSVPRVVALRHTSRCERRVPEVLLAPAARRPMNRPGRASAGPSAGPTQPGRWRGRPADRPRRAAGGRGGSEKTRNQV